MVTECEELIIILNIEEVHSNFSYNRIAFVPQSHLMGSDDVVDGKVYLEIVCSREQTSSR